MTSYFEDEFSVRQVLNKVLNSTEDGLQMALSSDIQIGAVEIKNGASDVRATVQAANTATGTATTALITQPVDKTGVTLGAGFSIPEYDYISLGYTGVDLTTVIYKSGGASGTTAATLTLAYTASVLQSVTKS